MNRWHRELRHYRLDWLIEDEAWHAQPVLLGAIVGTLSHVALDSIMHLDITPCAPWSNANLLYGAVSINVLHLLCLLSAAIGILGWIAHRWSRNKLGLAE